MENDYVLISFRGGGALPTVEAMPAEILKARLDEGYYGQNPAFADPAEKIDQQTFVGLVVVRGVLVKPKAVQVATRYEIP